MQNLMTVNNVHDDGRIVSMHQLSKYGMCQMMSVNNVVKEDPNPHRGTGIMT